MERGCGWQGVARQESRGDDRGICMFRSACGPTIALAAMGPTWSID